MPFTMTPEQAEIVHLTDEIVARERFAEHAFDHYRSGEAPSHNLDVLRNSGLLGLSVAQQYGGGGLTPYEALLATEKVTSACPITGTIMNGCDLGPTGILNQHGTPEQKQKYLRQLSQAHQRVSISLTEPGAGSQLTALQTRAEVVGDECIITGDKVFCSGADKADLFFVYVRFGPKTEDIGAVIVERNTANFEIGPTYTHMSGSRWAPLHFDKCAIPTSNILPLENGFRDLIGTYNLERAGAAIKAIGVAARAMTFAKEHVQTRTQFGQPLSDFQGVRWKFADMELKLEAARLLTYRAVANAVDGRPSRHESSLAKVAASEAANFICDEAIQVCGATGVQVEVGLEWLYRLARVTRIAGGASEVHRNIIAKSVLG